ELTPECIVPSLLTRLQMAVCPPRANKMYGREISSLVLLQYCLTASLRVVPLQAANTYKYFHGPPLPAKFSYSRLCLSMYFRGIQGVLSNPFRLLNPLPASHLPQLISDMCH